MKNCILYLLTIWLLKKNTCFSHLLCFLPHNYLQYFLISGDSNRRKNPQLHVKGTMGVLTVQALGAGWLPGCCDGLSHQQCLKCISFVPIFSFFSKYLHAILTFYWMYLESILRIFLYIILSKFLYWVLMPQI